jgi:hypothetical protein
LIRNPLQRLAWIAGRARNDDRVFMKETSK